MSSSSSVLRIVYDDNDVTDDDDDNCIVIRAKEDNDKIEEEVKGEIYRYLFFFYISYSFCSFHTKFNDSDPLQYGPRSIIISFVQ